MFLFAVAVQAQTVVCNSLGSASAGSDCAALKIVYTVSGVPAGNPNGLKVRWNIKRNGTIIAQYDPAPGYTIWAANGQATLDNIGGGCGKSLYAGTYVSTVWLVNSSNVSVGTPSSKSMYVAATLSCAPCEGNGGQRLAAPSITAPTTFEAYPNPASDKIHLQFEVATKADVKLTDMFGKTVFSAIMTEETEKEIDIQAIPNGIYILQVFVNGNVQTKKIQIQH